MSVDTVFATVCSAGACAADKQHCSDMNADHEV